MAELKEALEAEGVGAGPEAAGKGALGIWACGSMRVPEE